MAPLLMEAPETDACLVRAGRSDGSWEGRWATRKEWVTVFGGKAGKAAEEEMKDARRRNQREQRRMQNIRRSRSLLGNGGLFIRFMALRDAGFGGTLMRMHYLAGADRGMQDEAREYQRKEPEPQPCSQRAFSSDSS
jgi:hypothetical protein